jgi:SAM-dependent MidA family methyltransferase
MNHSLPQPSNDALAHSAQLCQLIQHEIASAGGWIPFSRFMELALYAPGLGYYAAGAHKFGEAGDFITAPEISALFGRSLARQLMEVMEASSSHILELGAGSGKLAGDILTELAAQNALPERYDILEVSADLRQRQREYLTQQIPQWIDRVHWLDTLPETISGAVIGNEVLDALPVTLFHLADGQIFERGVTQNSAGFVWQDQLSTQLDILNILNIINELDDYQSELSLAARGLIASLCQRLKHGALLFIDYGFGASEYYHPQRNRGTLMCHYRHYAHDDPFYYPGLQDLTAHVDFTAIAEAALDHGAEFLGYTTQAHFLLNLGILDLLKTVSPEDVKTYAPLSAQVQKLTSPAEMGELFKVLALGKGLKIPLSGFARGDRSRLL